MRSAGRLGATLCDGQSAHAQPCELAWEAAPAEAESIARAAQLRPTRTKRFFDKLAEQEPAGDGNDPFFGLASHPVDVERVCFFKEAAKGNP